MVNPAAYARYRAIRLARQQRAFRFYKTFIRPGDLVFDIGANVGDRTRAFLRAGARVVAIEPQPACVDRLFRLRKVNHRGARLTIVQTAVGSRPHFAKMSLASASTISSMNPEWVASVQESGRFADQEWGETIDVPVVTLDGLVGEFGRPAFCKIDVEGYEAEVIAGLSTPLRMLSFEHTPEYPSTEACIHHLTGIGMGSFNYSDGETLRFALPEWVDDPTPLLAELPPLSFGDIYARSN